MLRLLDHGLHVDCGFNRLLLSFLILLLEVGGPWPGGEFCPGGFFAQLVFSGIKDLIRLLSSKSWGSFTFLVEFPGVVGLDVVLLNCTCEVSLLDSARVCGMVSHFEDVIW